MKKRDYFLKILSIFLFILVVDGLLIFVNIRNKFHDVTIEIGTENIDLKTFIVSNMYLKRGRSLTDLNSIDLSEIGEHDVEFTYGKEKEKVKLKIVDTTAPEVEFQDLEKGLDYKYNYEDFIVVAKDYSEYNITSDVEELDIKLGKYKINVTVSDIYGNKTSKECILDIKLVHDKIEHELGTPLTKNEVLLSENIGNKELTKKVLNKVNTEKTGEYEIKFNYKNEEFKTNVIVKDTLGPKIVVNNISYYIGSKTLKNKDFVKSITDPSGVKDIKYEGTLDYKTLGVQKIKIIATDNLGNVSEKVAKLTVKNDDVGPVISGLKQITINRGDKINYLKGVKAVDKKDGKCEVTVDTSKVNTNKFGTYYAIYKAKDKSNNITTKKRKIVIKYNAADVENLFNDYYDKHLKGKSVMQMAKYIRKNIRYTSNRGDDPLFIALTQKKGSCYGHSVLLKKALDKAGIPNCIVYTNGKTHYWNYVYENGAWRHYDSNPGVHVIYVATDKEKLATKTLHGRTINKSLCPAEAK